jgi:hypothetical protein
MDEYELHGHLSEQLFRAVGGYVANFSRSVRGISQQIYYQQAIYLSYTYVNLIRMANSMMLRTLKLKIMHIKIVEV